MYIKLFLCEWWLMPSCSLSFLSHMFLWMSYDLSYGLSVWWKIDVRVRSGCDTNILLAREFVIYEEENVKFSVRENGCGENTDIFSVIFVATISFGHLSVSHRLQLCRRTMSFSLTVYNLRAFMLISDIFFSCVTRWYFVSVP